LAGLRSAIFGLPSLYFINLTVLDANGPLGESLRLRGGLIVGINTPPQRSDRVIDGRGGVMIPGLINAHDHLELNTFKRLKYRECYTHSRQWIEDIEARFDSDPDLIEPRRQSLNDRLLVSALKNLLSGVTTVCHHNPLHPGLLRNYPIRVVKGYNFCHSLFRGDDPLTSYRRSESKYPWIIHLAEGVDAEAEAEFELLDRLGAMQENTVLVHGVGLTLQQRQALIERGGGLIWCPGSNLFMFGQTAGVAELAQAGKLALGSDSRLSGEFDLLAELQVAHRTGQLSPQRLFETVTTGAARVLRLRSDGRGQIRVGGPADLVLLPPWPQPDPFAVFSQLNRAQVELVLLGGKPLVGSVGMQPLFEATRTPFAPVRVDGVEKLMPAKLVARLKQLAVREPGVVV
jgi:cytosine/adenosine deaminase-related metal-dependent hydrolase